MASSVKAKNKMENRDIYWIKEMIENGEIKFNEGVGASDNPIIFRFEEDYIVQADEFLYMDKHLDIRKIDTLKAFNEIEKVCDKLFEDKNNKVVDIDNYLGLEARMCIDCLFVNHGINFLEYDDYYIDAEHNFIRLNMKKLENVLSDSMVQIENVANKAQSDLNNDELFVEGEINCFCYEFDTDITKWVTEEAIIDYFEDYLQEEFKEIEKKYGVEPTIEIDYDGTPEVVIGVDLEACI